MTELLSSKVLVTETTPTRRNPGAGPAAVTGFIGTAERGPIGVQVSCTSFEEFKETFGGYAAGADLPLIVGSFFDNGGTRARVVRTAHYRDVSARETLTAKASTASIMRGDAELARFTARHPGTYGDTIQAELTVAENTVSVENSAKGKRVEHWPRLSTDPGNSRNYIAVLNANSKAIECTQVGREHILPDSQTVMLTGGDDGLVGLTARDFIGDATAQTGLRAFDPALDLSLLAMANVEPDAQRAARSYCAKERRGYVFALFDLPEAMGAVAAAAHVEKEKLAQSGEHGAMYWPRPLVANPAPHLYASRHVSVSPVGFVAGVIARLAAAHPGGVYEIPAGIEDAQLQGVVGFDNPDCLDEAKRDIVYPARINPLTTGDGLPYYIDGSQTLKGDGNCPWVSHRRGMSYIERALERQLQYVRHKAMNSALEARVYRETKSFLTREMENGAFASLKPHEAFRLDVRHQRSRRQIQVLVGLAFAEPAEFVWLSVSVDLAGPQDAPTGVN